MTSTVMTGDVGTRMSVLAVVPARMGSKGVPNKNLASVGGKPLIAWTLEAARRSRILDRVIVTTDNEAIAATARRHGAEVPFLRPPELARDDTPGVVPIVHALQWLAERENYQPDLVLCLQPTSPLRTAEDIVAAVRLLVSRDADSVVSVTASERPLQWLKVVDSEGLLRDALPGLPAVASRQDATPVFALNGAIYLARRERFLRREGWYGDRTYGYVMPRERSLDVDTPWDLRVADLLLREEVGRAAG